MKYFSMFTGVGGFELGIGDKAECIGFCETDRYASQLLANRFPNVKNYGDARTCDFQSLDSFDLLCGGFPCQSFSIAGKRRGFEDTRGTLFFSIAEALKIKKPKLVLLENVKGLLNHNKGETFKVIIQTLEELGYDVQCMVLNSKFFGVPQNRERVFIIGSLRGTTRPEILPFREGVSESVSESYSQVSNALIRGYQKNGGGNTMIKQPEINLAQQSKSQHSRVYNSEGISPTLAGASKLSGDCTPKILAQPLKFLQKNQKNLQGEYSFTIDGVNTGGLRDGTKIRRLTPIECERLQGFPDNWTKGFSDSQRYKMMGNAVTVNVIKAIVEKLLK